MIKSSFKSSSVWMAVLTFTAVVLCAILLSRNERTAEAGMVNAQPDVTMMTAGTNGGDEGLVVVDKRTQKMIVYVLKGNKLVIVAGQKL